MNPRMMSGMMGTLAFSVLGILPLSAATDPRDEIIQAEAVSVVDGDSITVVIDRKLTRVRLAGIDAPEGNQPFAIEAKESLHELCFWADVELSSITSDHYGRTLALVKCDGVDAIAEQVRRGMAWVMDQSATDRDLNKLQEEARSARRGLWAYDSPVPPWDWHSLGN